MIRKFDIIACFFRSVLSKDDLHVFHLLTFYFRNSILDGNSVFNSTDAETDTLFDNSDETAQAGGYRGRLPGRLSSSSLGVSTEPIRSINNIFPRPEFGSVPNDAPVSQ